MYLCSVQSVQPLKQYTQLQCKLTYTLQASGISPHVLPPSIAKGTNQRQPDLHSCHCQPSLNTLRVAGNPPAQQSIFSPAVTKHFVISHPGQIYRSYSHKKQALQNVHVLYM